MESCERAGHDDALVLVELHGLGGEYLEEAALVEVLVQRVDDDLHDKPAEPHCHLQAGQRANDDVRHGERGEGKGEGEEGVRW